ncbi:MAG: undecaprenyl/decaprenyl-phosphate alpha-N-acetylglucosaminyl 1-phosphate transferase [Candidatus Omnitrophica bacterium]|jgi:UDP-GlcNAc:undecaprenyl-phosphate GlcNAc-1-phosphate transferase|nr:undecaprenyl/decaprenyl-phosphate alpha-N-acetylglucosaminyl 1-phosphate transferase [Candidatus Omnitrophota bacterium]
MAYFFVVAISFIIVFLITPTIRYIALKFYAIDKTNHRKIHKKIVTKLGGLAIYLGVLGGLSVISLFDFSFFRVNFSLFFSLLIGITLILMLGIYDDFQGSSARLKFIIQIIISFMIIKSGFLLENVTIGKFININLGMFSIPITLLWLVGITNAINLLDGLDGLASGVVGVTSLFIFIFSLILQDVFVSCVALALFGAILAFLRYNFYPAKIFMGDTGSLFLGLSVGCLGVYKPMGSVQNHYFVPVVLLLFLPILDTVLAIMRRVLRRQNIFTGDSSHIHHYFMKLGFSQPETVIRFYIITFILGLFSLFIIIA